VLIKCETGEVVSEFHTFVRPVVNPSLTDFCQELTGITQADVDAAPTFPEALLCLTRWLEDQGFPARATEASEEGGTNASAEASGLLWVCDGDWDLRSMIPRQCVLSDVPQPAFMLRWADLRYASV
jgi:inhibitor of KinA sporulation pathway (predicted exonuclease)